MIGRRVGSFAELERPGDYYGPTPERTVFDRDGVEHEAADVRPAVWFLLPVERGDAVPAGVLSVHRVASPTHVFRECDDGSIEVRESILGGFLNLTDPPGGVERNGNRWGFHGYLDEGHVWRVLDDSLYGRTS